MTETPAQFTRRMMERYREVLEQIEQTGLNEDQKLCDKVINKILTKAGFTDTIEEKKPQDSLLKLSEILKKY